MSSRSPIARNPPEVVRGFREWCASSGDCRAIGPQFAVKARWSGGLTNSQFPTNAYRRQLLFLRLFPATDKTYRTCGLLISCVSQPMTFSPRKTSVEFGSKRQSRRQRKTARRAPSPRPVLAAGGLARTSRLVKSHLPPFVSCSRGQESQAPDGCTPAARANRNAAAG